jgi:hypothetical protein
MCQRRREGGHLARKKDTQSVPFDSAGHENTESKDLKEQTDLEWADRPSSRRASKTRRLSAATRADWPQLQRQRGDDFEAGDMNEKARIPPLIACEFFEGSFYELVGPPTPQNPINEKLVCGTGGKASYWISESRYGGKDISE